MSAGAGGGVRVELTARTGEGSAGQAPELGRGQARDLILIQSFQGRGPRLGPSGLFDRGLVADPTAHRQFIAVAVLRAVETGLPVVRASLGGPALFVAPDGRVLAESAPGQSGILAWDEL